MIHFLTNHKFDLLSYISIINFLNLPVRALIHDLQKKNLWASTRTHDPFFDNPKIWPTFIYRGEVPAHTFAKLPVRALINDPKKLFQIYVRRVRFSQWFETPFSNDVRPSTRAEIGQNVGDYWTILSDWIQFSVKSAKNVFVTKCEINWTHRGPCVDNKTSTSNLRPRPLRLTPLLGQLPGR